MKFFTKKAAMDESSQDKKMRVLTIALTLSGALNIGLIATGLFTKESAAQVAIRPSSFDRSHPETCLERTIAQMEKLSFHELVSYLTNKDPVDEGYLKRDLSLSCLVAFHHFHLEKALAFSPVQRRSVYLNETKIELFPGLSNEQYEGIIRFAYEEKWPLTSAGLFKLLQKWPETKEESLVQAFLVTPEFHALAMLFQKSESPQLVGTLIHLITEGSWELLEQFTKEQAQLFDLSVDRRRSLLLSYLAIGSKTAAQILLESDFAFVSKRLEDQGIIGMLSLLNEKSESAEKLCLELLRSPRSNAVWTKAACNLYAYAGEIPPTQISQQEAISRFEAQNAPQRNNGRNYMPDQRNNLTPAPQSGNYPQTNVVPTPTNQRTITPQNSSYPQNSSPVQNPPPVPGNQRTTIPQSSGYPQSPVPANQRVNTPQNNSTTIPLNGSNSLQNTLNQPQRTTPNQQGPNQRVTPITPKGPAHSHESVPPQQELGSRTTSRKHTVKEGESLWKISRQYNVKVDDIIKANQMEKDRLIPGMVLLIP